MKPALLQSVPEKTERQGFEPWVRLPVHTLSRRAPSTARAPLQVCKTAQDNKYNMREGGKANN